MGDTLGLINLAVIDRADRTTADVDILEARVVCVIISGIWVQQMKKSDIR